MEEHWLADRTTLRMLLRRQPQWTLQDLVEAVGRSRSWVKQWRARLRAAPPEDETVLHSRSRARKHPPRALAQPVIDRIREIRDHPHGNLQRTPGPETILYYLHHGEAQDVRPDRLPRSSRTIWRILKQYGRIATRGHRRHSPMERPAPLTVGSSTAKMPRPCQPTRRVSSHMWSKCWIPWMLVQSQARW